jgi:hypothetical protein
MDIFINQNINKFIKKGKYKNYKILYHITKLKYAKNILKNNFDVTKSKTCAFGKGINMTNDIKHLKNYYDEKKYNTVVISLVKYNKLLKNESYYKDINCEESQKYLKKYSFTRPKYLKSTKLYDGFYSKYNNIYVIKKSSLIYPLFICNYKKFKSII